MNKYMTLLMQVSPHLATGRSRMRPSEIAEYQEKIRVPEYIYSESEREARFGKKRTDWELVYHFGAGHCELLPWTRILTADRISPIAFYHGDKRTMIGAIWNPLEQSLSLEETVRRISWEVPALVKNYVVIARTLPWSLSGVSSLKILVKGSRACQAGGTWDYQVAEIATFLSRDISLDLYDINEVAQDYTISTRGCKVRVRRFSSFYIGDGSEYDVYVDDAYLSLGGPVEATVKSPYYSLKKHDNIHSNFLHTREGRMFSHSHVGIPSPCPCLLCSTLSEFSPTSTVFFKLRDHCLELGASPCTLPCYAASLDRRDTLSTLHSGQLIAETPAEVRKVVDVRHLCPTRQHGLSFVPSRPGDPLSVQLERQLRPLSPSDLLGWWKGKTVHFVGCESRMLAGESYVGYSGNSSFISNPAVIIFAGSLSNMSAVYADVVWCPDEIPSFIRTGRVHHGYYETVRKRSISCATVLLELVPEPTKLAVPSPYSRRINMDGSPISSVIPDCDCLVGGFCGDHMMVHHERSICRPARKKIRKAGRYWFAQGWFSPDNVTWYELQGGSREYAINLCDSNIIWQIG